MIELLFSALLQISLLLNPSIDSSSLDKNAKVEVTDPTTDASTTQKQLPTGPAYGGGGSWDDKN